MAKRQKMDPAQRAMDLMEQSRDFGTRVYPVDDDDDGTTNSNDFNDTHDNGGTSGDDEDANDFTDILEFVSSGEESNHS